MSWCLGAASGAFLRRATSCRYHPPGTGGGHRGLGRHSMGLALHRSPVPCTTRTILALLTGFPGPFGKRMQVEQLWPSIIFRSWDIKGIHSTKPNPLRSKPIEPSKCIFLRFFLVSKCSFDCCLWFQIFSVTNLTALTSQSWTSMIQHGIIKLQPHRSLGPQPQDIKPENLVFVSKARSKQLQLENSGGFPCFERWVLHHPASHWFSWSPFRQHQTTPGLQDPNSNHVKAGPPAHHARCEVWRSTLHMAQHSQPGVTQRPLGESGDLQELMW